MRRRRLGLLLTALGVALALLVGGLVFTQMSAVELLRASQPRTWVPVAAVDIPERSVLSTSQVTVVQVPDAAVPAGVTRYQAASGGSIDDAQKQRLIDSVKDQFTPQRIYKDEIINRDRLRERAAAGGARGIPSDQIPPGKVLYSLPVRLHGGNPSNDPVLIALLDAARPGDFVDVYYTSFEAPPGLDKDQEDKARNQERIKHLYTRRILQNLRVINVGFFPDPTGKNETTGRDDRALTLLVTPDEALTLKWLKDVAALDGNLELVLRSPLDSEPFPSTTISYDTLTRQSGLGTQR